MVGHSMGGLYAHYFLTKMPQRWKNKYIHSLTTLSTPWYGSAVLLRLYASGECLIFLFEIHLLNFYRHISHCRVIYVDKSSANKG